MPGSKCPQCKSLTVFKGNCSRCDFSKDKRPWVEIVNVGKVIHGMLRVDIHVAHKSFPGPLKMWVDTRRADEVGLEALIINECIKVLSPYIKVNIDSDIVEDFPAF